MGNCAVEMPAALSICTAPSTPRHPVTVDTELVEHQVGSVAAQISEAFIRSRVVNAEAIEPDPESEARRYVGDSELGTSVGVGSMSFIRLSCQLVPECGCRLIVVRHPFPAPSRD